MSKGQKVVDIEIAENIADQNNNQAPIEMQNIT